MPLSRRATNYILSAFFTAITLIFFIGLPVAMFNGWIIDEWQAWTGSIVASVSSMVALVYGLLAWRDV